MGRSRGSAAALATGGSVGALLLCKGVSNGFVAGPVSHGAAADLASRVAAGVQEAPVAVGSTQRLSAGGIVAAGSAALVGAVVLSQGRQGRSKKAKAAIAARAASDCCGVKASCVHPERKPPRLCGDCPRNDMSVGWPAEFESEGVYAAASFVSSAKSSCVHPERKPPRLCGDCPRNDYKTGGSLPAAEFFEENGSSSCVTACAGFVSSAKSSCVHPERKPPRLCGDCPRNDKMGGVPELLQAGAGAAVAALALAGMPAPVHADGLPDPQGVQGVQLPFMQQQGPQITGRSTYSRFLEFIDEGMVKKVDIYDFGKTVVAEVKFPGRTQNLAVDLPGTNQGIMQKLLAKNVVVEVHKPEPPNQALQVLGDVAFPLLLIGGLLFLRSQNPMAGAGNILGNDKKKVQVAPVTGVKFSDVAGIDEAKEELTEIVDFLKAPQRFVKVGAKIPRGVLLSGPPGTGKTLMAKALAGESGVPFIQTSAAEFIELFVGVGASRVRDIFNKAKEKAPCIVFIDEIDAIGRQRGAGIGGGNDEREQTLNQILTEMDGFEGNSGVIVVAATNRPDILDNALLRPGRFDRRVSVGLPDVKGRLQILQVHVKNKPLGEDIDLEDIAKRTPGFSGADLQNLMNESAILAARRGQKAITNQEVNDATDRVIAGLESRALQDNAGKRLVAYHEAGHALVGTLLPHHDMVNKVTLVPRGQAKGLTWFTPSEDQSLVSAAALKARVSGALGGRAAEQVVFGTSQVTSGAAGDLQQVERLARSMVTQFGMSAVGSIAIDDGGFMGPNYSEDLAQRIDQAVRDISDECYLTALNIISTHRAVLDCIVEELLEKETLTGDRLREIVAKYTEVPEKVAIV